MVIGLGSYAGEPGSNPEGGSRYIIVYVGMSPVCIFYICLC